MIEHGEFRFAERARHRHVPLEREFRGLGVERLAVLEFHAGPKLDRHLLAVGGGLVRQRELRHDVELFVDVEQLVAEGREHDAADIGARQRRIENVGILGEPDPQRGLGADAPLPSESSNAAVSRQPNARSSSDSSPVQTTSALSLPAACTDYTNPGTRRSFLRRLKAATSRLQRRRKAAVGGHDRVGRRQFRGAVAGGGMARCHRQASPVPRCGSARPRRGSGYESGSPAAD